MHIFLLVANNISLFLCYITWHYILMAPKCKSNVELVVPLQTKPICVPELNLNEAMLRQSIILVDSVDKENHVYKSVLMIITHLLFSQILMFSNTAWLKSLCTNTHFKLFFSVLHSSLNPMYGFQHQVVCMLPCTSVPPTGQIFKRISVVILKCFCILTTSI